MNTRMSWQTIIALFITISWVTPQSKKSLSASESGINTPLSEQDFRTVPGSARPWVYWWWLKGNVTKESITRELEEMKKQGIGGVLLFDPRGYHDDYYTGNIPVPLEIKLKFMSPGWREMIRHSVKEAARLGLKMSINLANTGGALRGPWDMEADGPKRLIWTAISLIRINLSSPELMICITEPSRSSPTQKCR